jgi:O-antigen/teichoic acid export membrane protein
VTTQSKQAARPPSVAATRPPVRTGGASAPSARHARHDISPRPNSIKRNLGWLLFSQAATWVVSISTLLIAPRVLGDHNFGQLSFVIVYISFFELLANMGTNTFLVKAIARDTGRVGRYLVNAVVLKVLMTLFLIGVAFGLGVALGMSDTTMLLIVAYSVGLLLNVIGSTIGAALTGLQLMAGLARWNMIQCYVGGIASLAILLSHGSLIAYAFVFNLSFIISIPPNVRRLWPHIRTSHHLDERLWIEILKGGLPFFILAALLVVYGTIDVPLLQAMTGSEEVGWYALAYRWVSVPAFFAVTVSSAFFPALSASGVHVTTAFTSLANKALRLTVFVATPAAIGIALIAEPFLTLLYRGEFQQAVPLMRILALHIPIVGLDVVLGSVAMASDRQRQWVIVSVTAAMFNPLLNLVAIPQSQRLFHNGAIGAAVVTVLTELLLMVGAIALRPRGVLDKKTVNGLVRIGLASVTMVPVVLLVRSAPLAVQILAGLVTYGFASLVFRTVSFVELRRWTNDTLRRRRAHPAVTPGGMSLEDVTAP